MLLGRLLRRVPTVAVRHSSAKSVSFRKVDGFVLQNRPGERHLVDLFRPKGGGREIRIELVDEQDHDLCTHMATDVFTRACGMFTALGITYEEAYPFFHQICKGVLNSGVSMLAYDGDRLVSFSVGKVQTRAEYAPDFDHQLHHDKPQVVIKPDYGDDVAAGPWSTKVMNCVDAWYGQAVRQSGKFLPADAHVLETGDMLGTHPAYARTGLVNRLIDVTLLLLREHKVDYALGHCVVQGSSTALTNIGFDILFDLPYDHFKVDGQLVWGQLPDGATGIRVVGKKLH